MSEIFQPLFLAPPMMHAWLAGNFNQMSHWMTEAQLASSSFLVETICYTSYCVTTHSYRGSSALHFSHSPQQSTHFGILDGPQQARSSRNTRSREFILPEPNIFVINHNLITSYYHSTDSSPQGRASSPSHTTTSSNHTPQFCLPPATQPTPSFNCRVNTLTQPSSPQQISQTIHIPPTSFPSCSSTSIGHRPGDPKRSSLIRHDIIFLLWINRHVLLRYVQVFWG